MLCLPNSPKDFQKSTVNRKEEHRQIKRLDFLSTRRSNSSLVLARSLSIVFCPAQPPILILSAFARHRPFRSVLAMLSSTSSDLPHFVYSPNSSFATPLQRPRQSNPNVRTAYIDVQRYLPAPELHLSVTAEIINWSLPTFSTPVVYPHAERFGAPKPTANLEKPKPTASSKESEPVFSGRRFSPKDNFALLLSTCGFIATVQYYLPKIM